jgi:hypothetical protein
MYETDGLRQLAALQNGGPLDTFRLVAVVKHTSYTQIEWYCGDCGLMTGHYSSLHYERQSTVCSDCSLRRYLSRDRSLIQSTYTQTAAAGQKKNDNNNNNNVGCHDRWQRQ